jgi:hypothetical protein
MSFDPRRTRLITFFLISVLATIGARADDVIKSVFLKSNTKELITKTTHVGIKFWSKKSLFDSPDSVDFAVLVDKDLIAGSEVLLIINSGDPAKPRALVRAMIACTPMAFDEYPNALAFFIDLSPELFSKATLHFSSDKRDYSVFCKLAKPK